MTRGLNLTLTAIIVVGICVGSALAFTPSAGPVPDVIIGDRTPGNTGPGNDLPSDPFTHGDSLEFLGPGNEPVNIYTFPDALHIFDYVSDEPNGVAGFTSDEDLIYEFWATNAAPASTTIVGDQRISINGTAISTSAYTTVAVDASGFLDFADIAFSDPPLGSSEASGDQGLFSYLFVNGAGSETVQSGDTTPQGDVALIDQVAMTVRVTNQSFADASDEFFVFTVDNGPDAISGLIADGPNYPGDLSGRVYNGSGNTPALLGPTYPGDPVATGVEIGDNDVPADGSVSDLQLTTGNTNGDFFHNWTSPGAFIPFVQDGTYHVRWNMSSTISGLANPDVRFRWAYTNFATLGGGDVVADNSVSPTTAGGRDYILMFDQQDVASATNNVNPGEPENSIRLFWENYDFDQASGLPGGTIGGGQLELNSVDITRLNRAALVGAGSAARVATDYTDTAVVANTGVNFSNAPNQISVAKTTTNATITATLTNTPSTVPAFAHPYGDLQGVGNSGLFLNDFGLGFVPFTPAATDGFIYRISADVDTSANSTTTVMPDVTLAIASFQGTLAQLYTSTTQIKALQFGGAATNPAADGLNNYAGYLALPPDADLNGGAHGNNLAGSVRLTDAGNGQGGAVTVTNLRIDRIPEALLP